MFQMATGTSQFAQSLSVFSHFKCYPLPHCPNKVIGSGRLSQVALVGAGGSGPRDPPPGAARGCVRTSDVSSRQCLASASRRQLVVPRHLRSKFGRRSFSVAAPMVWNSSPDSRRDPTLSIDNFRSILKTHLFAAQRDT